MFVLHSDDVLLFVLHSDDVEMFVLHSDDVVMFVLHSDDVVMFVLHFIACYAEPGFYVLFMSINLVFVVLNHCLSLCFCDCIVCSGFCVVFCTSLFVIVFW
jgi:hypothetical protein